MRFAALALLCFLPACSASPPSEPPPEFVRSQSEPQTLSPQEWAVVRAYENWRSDPEDLDAIIWYGRRVGYTGDFARAVEIYTEGLRVHPDSARLLRHRGHRWISLREFEKAIMDLSRGLELVAGQPDRVEQDGLPNARNQPTSTLHTNLWYHLALAHYCRGDFLDAQLCWEVCRTASDNPDMEIAARYWYYHALTRAGDRGHAAHIASTVSPDLDIIENHAYHQLLLLYAGKVELAELEAMAEGGLLRPTVLYGIARWHAENGRQAAAREILEQLAGTSAAFGVIAAESDLARRGARSDPRRQID